MALHTIGDLAQSFVLRQQSSTLKQQMNGLAKELSSGLVSDPTMHLSGNFTHLADVKHKLQVLDSLRAGAEQGRRDTGLMQTALERFQSEAEQLSSTALLFGAPSGAMSISNLAGEARESLGAMLSALNTSFGGRSLFAGADVASPAVVPSDVFIAAVNAAVAGASTTADINTAMDNFFDTPGGDFDTLIYQGSTTARASYPLGDGEAVTLDLRADDPAIRETLKQIAIAVVLDNAGHSLSGDDQANLALQVGEALLVEQSALTGIRADLGFAESRIDRAATRHSAEISGLNLIQAELLAADPYETATELEAVQIQLETIYTLTSRMSRLNLVNFLR